MTSFFHHRWSLYLPLTLALTAACVPASALGTQSGTTDAGIAFMSGGVSEDQRTQMRSERRNYSYWLSTAARGGGAYLAEVKVRITEAAGGKLVLDVKMSGPWLFVALPQGRYAVQATYADGRGDQAETQYASPHIIAGGHDLQPSMLYFRTDEPLGKPQADSPKP